MGKDAVRLMDVYKKYLEATADLVSVAERHNERNAGEVSDELITKQKEFQTHIHNLIEQINNDLHTIIKINWELKALEEKEKEEE